MLVLATCLWITLHFIIIFNHNITFRASRYLPSFSKVNKGIAL